MRFPGTISESDFFPEFTEMLATKPLDDEWPHLFCFTPANIRLDEDVLKTFWRRLSSSSSEDVFIKTNIFALLVRLQDVLIKTNIFVLAICLQDVFRTFSRRLQGMFKTSSKRLQNLLQKCLQDIFKTSSRCFENVFKTSSRHLQDVLKSFLRRPAKTVICRRPLTTLLRNLWSVYKISKCDKSFSYFSFSLYYTF